jgi:hypothetical protein
MVSRAAKKQGIKAGQSKLLIVNDLLRYALMPCLPCYYNVRMNGRGGGGSGAAWGRELFATIIICFYQGKQGIEEETI